MSASIQDLYLVENIPTIRGVDLFCGVGGLTHGLIRQGLHITHGIDIDPYCRFPYENNNNATFIESDVANISGSELENILGDAQLRLLAGCAPCQPFSTYSHKGRVNRNDRKWELIKEFGRLTQELQPELLTMENVPQLIHHRVFEEFLEGLNGYKMWYGIVDCTLYGVPQTRKRLVLLASRLGDIALLPPSSFNYQQKSVRESISHLPHLAAGEVDPNDPLHTAPTLSELNLRRIQASRPGGTWRDWDEELIADCHRKGSGKTYPSVYGRMEWDMPSPTITTQCFGFGNGRFGHPEQDRAISLREAAILQTFPEAYNFVAPGESVSFSRLGRLIGNAVPVRIGEIVAVSLLKHVKDCLYIEKNVLSPA
ncbi:site-specific DNA-methyltransferase [Oscillochloris trichoides DG-6]|uniref:DNA (cytosine-5-)-methyltransferase n=1 Tax=Oscillochloris trichoides DG-6 TaxID=765420 RepID=E1ID19_9CHLR|nr:DNA cytosine methyltransferase [Oscillochloris trichoides]EFO80928.1 site-specific DNA-methyltransferase [Oscillochloris trichoides DG-6]